MALHGGPGSWPLPAALTKATPPRQLDPRLPRVRDDPLRNFPDPIRHPGGLLRPLLRGSRNYGLAGRDPARVHLPLYRAPRVEVAVDSHDRVGGARGSVTQRPLHSRYRGLLRSLLRDSARDLRSAGDAADRKPLAGADRLL